MRTIVCWSALRLSGARPWRAVPALVSALALISAAETTWITDGDIAHLASQTQLQSLDLS